MATYDDLKSLIEEKPAKKAIKAKYGSNVEREIWPHVLGKNAGGFEVVLCYQGVGPDGDTGYRCFKVEDLELVGNAFNPSWNPLKKFKYKDVLRQNCVDIGEVEAFR